VNRKLSTVLCSFAESRETVIDSDNTIQSRAPSVYNQFWREVCISRRSKVRRGAV